MRLVSLLCTAGALAGYLLTLANPYGVGARLRPRALAGWYGVFPELPGYRRTFLAPAFSPSQPDLYRQTARYVWTGDADRTWELTLARDPAHAAEHGVPAGEGASLPPKRLTIRGHAAWLYDLRAGARGRRDRVAWQLSIGLAINEFLLLESFGYGPWDDPAALATQLDLARCAQALAHPPRIHFGRDEAAFRAIPDRASFADVTAWVGDADADISSGSGIHIYVYNLPDGSRALLGFPDEAHLLYAYIEQPDGRIEKLIT